MSPTPHDTRVSTPRCWALWSTKTTLAASMSLILSKNTTQVISKYNFCQVFKDAWLNAVVPANVCAGFKKAGVCPFNPKAVPVYHEQSKDHDKDAHSGHGKLRSHARSRDCYRGIVIICVLEQPQRSYIC